MSIRKNEYKTGHSEIFCNFFRGIAAISPLVSIEDDDDGDSGGGDDDDDDDGVDNDCVDARCGRRWSGRDRERLRSYPFS